MVKIRTKRLLQELRKISKPGLRVYAGKDELPRVLGGLGVAIISTNKGVITDKEARKAKRWWRSSRIRLVNKKLGGKAKCHV